jgi:general stress protein 26
MDEPEETKSLADLMDPGTTLMVATMRPTGRFDSRPLTVADVSNNTIRVLIDTSAAWAKEILGGVDAHVTLSDNRKNTWASLTTSVEITDGNAEINELWNPFASAYFDDGRNSAGIGVMHIRVESGTYWTSPSGRLGSIISMIKAKVGSPNESGDHGRVDV